MEGEIVIKRWEDLDGEVSSYRLCCILSTLPPIDSQEYFYFILNQILGIYQLILEFTPLWRLFYNMHYVSLPRGVTS